MYLLIFMGFPVLVSITLWFYFLNKYSLLSVLILLEILTFSMILSFYGPLLHMYSTMSYFVTLFSFTAGGAAVGLALLISMARLSGSDFIKSMA
uniref:NADH dehydrogenase subunit 4L n=1 Tax=Laeocathaica amdoana TaxID=2936362 RepID=UPI0022FD578F|nr:NADH dehydrogenase subunit 4L [Laeocathaica amdoana]WBF92698.1 NADH dehydrogenase subunit 4L [Laeocathaica amdoana]